VDRRPRLAAISTKALIVGFSVAIVAAFLLALVLMWVGIAPDQPRLHLRELTLFISHPNWYSGIVAVLAGVVGMLALVAARSGPMIGVFISVTTIPAASNIGVAAAYGEWREVGGAASQLAINITAILISGMAVLMVAGWSRRRRRAADQGERAIN
jgi:uncharacterized hydrophobic protein (TIGR00271 family)